MISVCFQGKPFNFTVIQVYAPISNTEEAEVEQFYEDLKEILEKKKKTKNKKQKRCHFHYRGLESQSRSQETPGVHPNLDLGYRMKQGKS